MKFKTLTGRVRTIPKPSKYLIKWRSRSRSKFQTNVKKFLKQYWKHHVVFEEFPAAGTKMTFDFFNATDKIMIEVQGNQHKRYVPFFHAKNKGNFLNQLRRDADKRKFCEINSIRLVEIYEEDELSEDLLN